MRKMRKQVIAKANLIAKDLHTPKYRLRVIESKKRYDRKSGKLGSAHGDMGRHKCHGYRI